MITPALNLLITKRMAPFFHFTGQECWQFKNAGSQFIVINVIAIVLVVTTLKIRGAHRPAKLLTSENCALFSKESYG